MNSDAMVDVTFWANGFTVGDGPLREFGIAENDVGGMVPILNLII